MATGATGCDYMSSVIAGCNGATGTNPPNILPPYLAIGLYTNQNYPASNALPCGNAVWGRPFVKGDINAKTL